MALNILSKVLGWARARAHAYDIKYCGEDMTSSYDDVEQLSSRFTTASRLFLAAIFETHLR